MSRVRWAVLVVTASLLVMPVGADPAGCVHQIGGHGALVPPPSCIPLDAPPQDFTASYDEATEVLTLSWNAPDSATAPDSYNVYRDGALLTTTTTTTTDDDLTGFQGYHAYWVTGVWGTAEKDASIPLYLGKAPLGLPGCPIASVTIYTAPPDAGYSIHDECIPP